VYLPTIAIFRPTASPSQRSASVVRQPARTRAPAPRAAPREAPAGAQRAGRRAGAPLGRAARL